MISGSKSHLFYRSVLCDLNGVEPTATPPRSTNSEEKDPDSAGISSSLIQ